MGDRMFASEGDSVDVGHHGPTARAGRWDDGRPPRGPAGGDDATAGVTRRLQGRLDRHLWLLERMRFDQLMPEPAVLPELLETARRMRRDTESLLLLAGHDPGTRPDAPRRLSDVLGDAASAAEEPRRVDVRPAPAATVDPAVSVEFLHVLAELVDHVTAVYPGARVELASRAEPLGGITVDVVVDGAVRHDPDGLGGRRAVAAAELLATRSYGGIELRRPPGGAPPSGSGLVASVHCPATGVTVEEPPRPMPSIVNDPFPVPANGSGYHLLGNGWPSGAASSPAGSTSNGTSNGAGRAAAAPALGGPEPAPAYVPSASSQVDELFGPLLDLPVEPMDDRFATPIFEAIASAWFREGEPEPEPARNGHRPSGGGPLDWETPSDGEWREAAARAARVEPTPTTATGLPRRRPGNQLVPPPRAQTTADSGPGERVPDRVRDRLSTYQRGLRQGRHRAPGHDGPDLEDW